MKLTEAEYIALRNLFLTVADMCDGEESGCGDFATQKAFKFLNEPYLAFYKTPLGQKLYKGAVFASEAKLCRGQIR